MAAAPWPPLLLLYSALLTVPGAWATTTQNPPDWGTALNLTFDPGTWTLTWARPPVGMDVKSCTVTTPSPFRVRWRVQPRGGLCRFRPLELHLGAELEVEANYSHGPARRHRLGFVNAGHPGSGAMNLTCEIHDASFLSCEWGVGPAAPTDVHYSLHVLNATGHDAAHCFPPLGPDPALSCQAKDLSWLPRRAYIIVRGQSRVGPVQFLDAVVNTKLIERLCPPREVSASCNSSHCSVAWAPPPTWAPMSVRDFLFEVEWKSSAPGSLPHTVRIGGEDVNTFDFPSPAPRGRHEVRVRAGDVRSKRWSSWSPAFRFGSEDVRVPGPLVSAATAIAVVLCVLGLGVTCIRRLCTPIPRIPDKVSDNACVNPETLRKDLQRL